MGHSQISGDPAASVATDGIVSRPELFALLAGAAGVTLVSSPAGSGKTSLLRSWLREARLEDDAAWVSVEPEERDPQRFWLSLLDALRDAAAGSAVVRAVSAAPDLDLWALVERLLEDLGSLERPLWLVIDDLHELRSEQAMRQLELLLMRAPAALRFVLVTRHDLRLRLHRLRLEGGLSEIRAAELRFTLDESRALLEAAGVQLSDSALAQLHERTEGWAAGLRLAALALAGHPDPDWFAAEFSGSERTVAEYLLVEVLERQPDEVRRLLLRASVLERVSGPLADLLTGESGGERILNELEEANAFVVALDSGRSWFRYHHLFADLLALELRRTAPDDLATLHDTAAEWFAGHGYPLEAIRHAQAAGNWSLAAQLLSDHWLGLTLDGQGATAHELLTGFPAGLVTADPELAALMAADSLSRGELREVELHLELASRGSESVRAGRRGRFQLILAVVRLSLARQQGDVPAVAEEATRMLTAGDAPGAGPLSLGEDLRSLALITLGLTELWALRVQDAERHLAEGLDLAREIERPYLELIALAHGSLLAVYRSYTLAAQRSREAIELAEQHGWSGEPVVGIAYLMLGGTMLGQARLEDTEQWLERAERTLRAEVEPAATAALHEFRGLLELAGGHYEKALASLQMAEQLASGVTTSREEFRKVIRCFVMQTLVKTGETARAEALLAEMAASAGESAYMDLVVALSVAVLRLAQDDPQAATLALMPVLEDSGAAGIPAVWLVHAWLLEAIARDGLGDARAAVDALERALDLAEPDGVLLPFLLHPAPGLLERQSRHRTTHVSLITQILTVQSGGRPASQVSEPERLREPLSESELRVLRYLPTNLSRPEIAGELYLSVHTIKTHIQHLYDKLGAHSRAEAVERARTLGLLAPGQRIR